MKTDKIRDLLELNFGLKESYTKADLDTLESLYIDRFDIDGTILNVDYSDLLLFSNLKYLTISKCILDYNFFEIIKKIDLETLTLSNCEIIDDVSEIIDNLRIKNLNIENTNFNFKWFKNLYFKSLIIRNMDIDTDFIVNTKSLDISKSNLKNYDFLNSNVIQKLIISTNQYTSFFDNYNGHLIIMEDNGQFILREVNNG